MGIWLIMPFIVNATAKVSYTYYAGIDVFWSSPEIVSPQPSGACIFSYNGQ